MFEVHLVDRSNRSSYQDQIEQHYRIRHQIYVEGRGWHELRRPDGREIDQFDTSDATYLLGISPDGNVVAGSRFVPTLKPHLMSEVFPQVARGAPPRGEDIFEWTRIFVVPALLAKGRASIAAGRVYCAILEFCLARRIRQLSIVCEPYWHARLERLGWNPQRLGDTVQSNDGPIIGLLVHMTPTALERTRLFYGIAERVFRQGSLDA